ncbi:MAG: tRNA uridine(34) 5-carboxymethylaminomethyl modification radical SAM/GNAT enzyme Elp3 [Anaerolineae bacterium]|nr:tRNA uridine(34) 5-carboxymethylaminomethyl modification radical SAM/GNAT enzyme Elp3 [Anaerolineae bacterium]
MAIDKTNPNRHTAAKRPRHRFVPRAKGTSPEQQAEWRTRHSRPVDLGKHQEHLLTYIEAIQAAPEFDGGIYGTLVRRLSRAGHPTFSKDYVRRGYLALVDAGVLEADDETLRRLTMKPIRTLSGVAPVTVLTKPYPCPGQCIFCPDDAHMPKSYLSNEPGAMRALMLDFDPFVQVDERLKAMARIGHTTDKVELLILGGTWSAYLPDYREWFVRRCFDAMNGCQAQTIEEAHRYNERAAHRNTGIVIETRPDRITPAGVHHLRRLGVTRVQLGVQSLDDRILALNKRGETSADARRAMRLLRGAGFKVAVHWMPNLLGATPESDLVDFRRLWEDPSMRPDEVKIYPTGLLRGTELYDHYRRGDYRPYSDVELIDLLVACKQLVPPYCRLNRVMRDIPAPEIVDGVTTSNLRQIVQQRMRDAGTLCRCIRCREVRRETVDAAQLRFERLTYDTDHSHEIFLSAVTPEGKLAGFLRLSLPTEPAPLGEIDGQAIIRQLQVYGPALALADQSDGQAQHQGIGGKLIAMARAEASDAGFEAMAVISAAGTRDYYRKHGFTLGELYMSTSLVADGG